MDQLKVILLTIFLTLAFKTLISFVISVFKYVSNLRDNLKLTVFNMLMWLPYARAYLAKERQKCQTDFTQRVKSKRKQSV